MFKKIESFAQKYQQHNPDLALLLIRLGLAVVFLATGWAKWQNLGPVTGFFASLGLGAFFVYLVAVVEFGGGLAMLTGLASRWFGLALAVDMFFAMYLVTWKKGGLTMSRYELMLLLMSLAIFFAGPGKYTLRRLLKK